MSRVNTKITRADIERAVAEREKRYDETCTYFSQAGGIIKPAVEPPPMHWIDLVGATQVDFYDGRGNKIEPAEELRRLFGLPSPG